MGDVQAALEKRSYSVELLRILPETLAELSFAPSELMKRHYSPGFLGFEQWRVRLFVQLIPLLMRPVRLRQVAPLHWYHYYRSLLGPRAVAFVERAGGYNRAQRRAGGPREQSYCVKLLRILPRAIVELSFASAALEKRHCFPEFLGFEQWRSWSGSPLRSF